MARLKSPAQPAPQSLEQALGLLGRFATIAADIERTRVEADAAIANIKGALDAAVKPAEAELRDLVKQLKPWWSVAREELTGGKRKSMELGGCLIGHRMSTPKLTFWGAAIGKANEDNAIEAVEVAEFDHFLRIKTELDKQLLLKALAADDQSVRALGFAASQKEEFFVDRLPPKPDTVITVADAGEAA